MPRREYQEEFQAAYAMDTEVTTDHSPDDVHSVAGGQSGRRYLKLLPLGEATKKIATEFEAVGTETTEADVSLGRVCAMTVRSKQNIPLRTTCAMDGYAVRSEDINDASPSEPCALRINTHNGPLRSRLQVRRGEAVAVSTGDELPRGTDAVVRIEHTRLVGESALLFAPVPKWTNVSFAAEDVRTGQVLLRRGEVITPAAMALLISAGVARLRVYRAPSVGILSVGKGLTSFREASPGRTVNNFANLLLGYLSDLGVEARAVGIARDESETGAMIDSATRRFDMLVVVGGISVGPGDMVPDAVLRGTDSRLIFHGLRAVPLRPAGLASVRGRPVALLPGHAVSVALSFFMVALPVLNVIGGLTPSSRRAVLEATASKEFRNERPIDALLLATLEKRGGSCLARPLGWGSNLQSNLALANGFVHLRPRQRISAGEEVEVQLLGASQLMRIAG